MRFLTITLSSRGWRWRIAMSCCFVRAHLRQISCFEDLTNRRRPKSRVYACVHHSTRRRFWKACSPFMDTRLTNAAVAIPAAATPTNSRMQWLIRSAMKAPRSSRGNTPAIRLATGARCCPPAGDCHRIR